MKQKSSTHKASTGKIAQQKSSIQLSWSFELLVAIAALLCDLNSWGHQFVMDDISLIVGNPAIQEPSRILRLFISPFLRLPNGAGDLYRPFTALTLAINYWISGPNPNSFHLLNRLLHILICLGIFWTVRRLIPKPPLTALFTALLFAVHPIQTEAITYINGRADALATLFFILAWYFYVRLQLSEHFSTKFYLLSALLFFLALLSKENAITWLAVMLLTDLVYFSHSNIRDFFQRLRQHLWRLYAGFLVTTLAFLAFRFAVLRGVTGSEIQFLDNPLVNAAPLVRVLTALKILFQCLGLFFAPLSFSTDYSYNQIPLVTGMNSPVAWAILLLTAIFLGLLIWSFKHLPNLFFGLGFFAITYLIVSNLTLVIGTIRADRLLYMPIVGLCLSLGTALAWVHTRLMSKTSKRMFAVFMAAILLMLAVKTIQRNRDWQDAFSLSLQEVKSSPQSAKAHINLGALYVKQNQADLALQQYRIAESIKPDIPALLIDLGILLKQQGQMDEALAYLRRAIALAPKDAQAHNNLGLALKARGDLAGAMAEFDSVIQQDPNNADAHFNKGLTLRLQGKVDEAIREYNRTLDIDPSHEMARNNLNFILENKDKLLSPQTTPEASSATPTSKSKRRQ